ncbi:DUF58 domain-containing protein [Schaalia suimastitidis]|uniref:DUF58 domain-containing protein n=1 Tax=Schaalia suimastitidis TaxID=121163 RepID=UPI000407A334|nr:DUF58 domain-containing protein [Schaalia suimastitidis]
MTWHKRHGPQAPQDGGTGDAAQAPTLVAGKTAYRWRVSGLMVALTLRGWGLLTLGIVASGIWWVTQLRELYVAAIFLVSTVILSLVWALTSRLWLRPHVAVRTSTPTPYVGQEVHILMTLAPRHHMNAHLSLDTRVTDAEGTHYVHHECSGSAATPLVFTVRAAARGVVTVGGVTLKWREPLGLARIRMYRPVVNEVVVLPVPHPLPIADAWLEGRRSNRLDNDSDAEALMIRQYRRGDPPRAVHWKHSARHHDLLVKTREGAALPLKTLVVDTRHDSWDDQGHFDCGISVAVALLDRWRAHDIEAQVGSGLYYLPVGASHSAVLRALAVATLSVDAAPIDYARQQGATVITGATNDASHFGVQTGVTLRVSADSTVRVEAS